MDTTDRPSASSSQMQQQAQRLRSFRSLLDPTDLLPGHAVADLYSLRHLCLQSGGIPDVSSTSSDGWLRAQAWRVLLGYLTPEKVEWKATLEKRRAEYYQFVADFLPQHQPGAGPDAAFQGLPGKLSERDALLDQIFRDLARSRKNAFAFYREEVKPSWSCPLTPAPAQDDSPSKTVPRLDGRHGLLRRLELINTDYALLIQQERSSLAEDQSTSMRASQSAQTLITPSSSTAIDGGEEGQKPSITLQPASPARSFGENLDEADESRGRPDDQTGSSNAAPRQSFTDQRWHSLLRILYIYALLNPSMGYVQGMNEVLFVLLYVFGTSASLPSSEEDGSEGEATSHDEAPFAASTSSNFLDHLNDSPGAHAEADAFWCFSSLIGEVRGLYDFDGIDHASAKLRVTNKRQSEIAAGQDTGGMGSLLRRFSLRLRWLDEELWRALRDHSLDPRLPYYSFRWLACLVSTELSLPSIVRVWDALLAESAEAGERAEDAPPKIDFLIDICCALLTNVRGQLLDALQDGEEGSEEDAFSRAMAILQSYPDDDIGPVIEMACLYRQKRLAAPLTGDAPPTEDEEDLSRNLRNRALNALREWRSTSASSSNAGNWLTNTPKRTEDRVGDESITSSASPSSRFQRYAEALQTSDAAASLSKASTNWQAKAMATWAGSRSGHSTPTKEGKNGSANHLTELGPRWLQRLRSTSESSSPSRPGNDEQTHPALRWSRLPPDIPIPDVLDSPPERHDYVYAPPNSGFVSVNRLAAANALNGLGDAAQHGTSLGSASSVDAGDATPNSSPAMASFSRFAHLPSLQHAAAAGIRSSPTAPHSNGPKPLLLQKAARPPREHSSSGSVNGDEPASRKVSSGPMAANISPRGSAFVRRRADNMSSGASQRDSTHTSGSLSSSVFRGGESPALDTTADEAWSYTSHAGQATPPVPPLPSKNELETVVTTPPSQATLLPETFSSSIGTKFTSSKGTVASSAFGKGRIATQHARGEDGEDDDVREDHSSRPPAFGQVASSADVPLISKASLQRKTARKESISTATEGSSAKHASLEDIDTPATRTSVESVSSVTNDHPSARPLGPRQSARGSLGYFENPRSAPVPPSTDDERSTEVDGASSVGEEVRKYTLTDESVAPFPQATVTRQSSDSSNRRSLGMTRNRRTYSGKREKAVRRGSERGSLQHDVERATEVREVTEDEGVPDARRETDSEQETDMGSHRDVPRRRQTSNRLAVIAPGGEVSAAMESGTSVTPSPGPEVGKVVRAEELLTLLQHSGDRKAEAGELLSLHGFDQPQFISAEDIHDDQLLAMDDSHSKRSTKASATHADPRLLGPRSQAPSSMPTDVDDSEREQGGASEGGEEWHDAGLEEHRTPEAEDHSASFEDGMDAIGSALAFVDADATDDDRDDHDE